MAETVEHRLRERVKELTALHQTARLLQDPQRPLDAVMPEVVAMLPPAWQHPEVAEGRICWGDRVWSTPGFAQSPWRQAEPIRLRDGPPGSIELIYREARPPASEGPFLTEERELIRSLAEMLRAAFQHRCDYRAILASREDLERKVAERTAILRQLASEIGLAEERERRQIAEGLHDHLGQALAIIKLRLRQLRGDAVLGGHGDALGELVTLCDQAIRYSRELTFELSPPVLYELGLGPALDRLAEETGRRHGIPVRLRERGRRRLPAEAEILLWKAARELLHNVVKHGQARSARIELDVRGDPVRLSVTDDGRGFDVERARRSGTGGFGLFSIEERLHHLGGQMLVDSQPGRGSRVQLRLPCPGAEG